MDTLAKRGTSRTFREFVDLCDALSVGSNTLGLSDCLMQLSPMSMPLGEGFHTTFSWDLIADQSGLEGRQKGRSRVRRKRAPRLPFQRPVGPKSV